MQEIPEATNFGALIIRIGLKGSSEGVYKGYYMGYYKGLI